MVNIAVIVISSESDVYQKLKDCWRLSIAKTKIPVYFVQFYDQDQDIVVTTDEIKLKGKESLKNIFKKTALAFEVVTNLHNPDYIIRTNLSSFYIWPRLERYLIDKPREKFCSAIVGKKHNLEFPSGCGMILSKDVAKLWINSKEKVVIDNDDVEFGKILAQNSIKILPCKRLDAERNQKLSITEIPSDCFHLRGKLYWDMGKRKSIEVETYKYLVEKML